VEVVETSKSSARKGSRGRASSGEAVGAAEVAVEAEEEPEEVRGDSAEVLKMRQLHEVMEMAMMNKKRKRDSLFKIVEAEKKRVALEQMEHEQDRELDSSVLDPEEEEEEEEEEESEEEEVEVGGWKIDTTRSNSRKIGSLEVQVLAEDPLDPLRAFSVSQAATQFKSNAAAKNPRVKYANFVAQKKKAGGPSKTFSCK
jgi:hypothetical protein